MTETKHHEDPQFPEIGENGEVSQDFWNEYDVLKELWSKPAGVYEVEVKLPQVVGYVPEEERARFDNPDQTDEVQVSKAFERLDLDRLKQNFPGIWGVVQADLDRIGVTGFDDTDRVHMRAYNKFVAAHHWGDGFAYQEDDTIRPVGGWHLDNPGRFVKAGDQLKLEGSPAVLQYSVRNKYPTLYFQGLASLKIQEYGSSDEHGVYKDINLDGANVPTDGLVVPAPDYGIVRMGPLSPHSASVFPKDAWGTFLRISVVPDQDIWTLRPAA